jgi:hypothetical protein
MNAPERIEGVMIAPGVLCLRESQKVDSTARTSAARAILRQLARAKPVRAGRGARHYLAQLRARHGR